MKENLKELLSFLLLAFLCIVLIVIVKSFT